MEEPNATVLVTEEVLARIVDMMIAIRDPLPKPVRAIVFRLGAGESWCVFYPRYSQKAHWTKMMKPLIGMQMAVGDAAVIFPERVFLIPFRPQSNRPGSFSLNEAYERLECIISTVYAAFSVNTEGAAPKDQAPSAG